MSINISEEKYFNNNAIYLLISIIYLLDQKINSIFNINGLGFILLLFILIISNQIHTKPKDLFLICSGLLYIILSICFSPCELSFKLIFSIILLPLLVIIIFGGYLNKLVTNNNISIFLITSVSVSLVLSANLDKFFYLDRIARFYYEYSHVALYIGPFIIYRLFCNYKDKYAWFSLIVIAIYSFSSTLLLGLIPSFLLIIKINKLKKFAIILLLPLIVFSFFYSDHIIDRFLGLFHNASSENTNLSSLVWLNGFSMAYQYLMLTNGLGIGFNQMGCNNYGEIGAYSALIAYGNNGVILNFEDGSFAASKIISELGLAGIFIVSTLTIYSLNVIYKAFAVKNNSFVNYLILAGAISTLLCLYVRSAGFYQLHFIVALSMLLGQGQRANSLRN